MNFEDTDVKNIVQNLKQFPQELIAYKLGREFAESISAAINIIELQVLKTNKSNQKKRNFITTTR